MSKQHGWLFPKHNWKVDDHDHWSSLFGTVERTCMDCGKRERLICDYEHPVKPCKYYGV